jgi:hypothetical protein
VQLFQFFFLFFLVNINQLYNFYPKTPIIRTIFVSSIAKVEWRLFGDCWYKASIKKLNQPFTYFQVNQASCKLLTTNDTAGPTITSVTSGLGKLMTTLAKIVFTSMNNESASITKEEKGSLVTISRAVAKAQSCEY